MLRCAIRARRTPTRGSVARPAAPRRPLRRSGRNSGGEGPRRQSPPCRRRRNPGYGRRRPQSFVPQDAPTRGHAGLTYGVPDGGEGRELNRRPSSCERIGHRRRLVGARTRQVPVSPCHPQTTSVTSDRSGLAGLLLANGVVCMPGSFPSVGRTACPPAGPAQEPRGAASRRRPGAHGLPRLQAGRTSCRSEA
jgi:hypothetical protein